MIDDTHTTIFHFESFLTFTPKERWIGIRNYRDPEQIKEEWKNRKGTKQWYQLNLIPCLGLHFYINRWHVIDPKIEKKKSKKHWWKRNE